MNKENKTMIQLNIYEIIEKLNKENYKPVIRKDTIKCIYYCGFHPGTLEFEKQWLLENYHNGKITIQEIINWLGKIEMEELIGLDKVNMYRKFVNENLY